MVHPAINNSDNVAAIHSRKVVNATGKNQKSTASECIMAQYKKERNVWLFTSLIIIQENIMKLSTIHHIAIIGSDYHLSKDFYVNKLGFSIIRENYREERNDWKIDLSMDGKIELELFIVSNPPKRVSYPEACGLRHLAFYVESVEETVKQLALIGIECEPIRVDEFTKKKMTFFFDPDGLPLEIHE